MSDWLTDSIIFFIIIIIQPVSVSSYNYIRIGEYMERIIFPYYFLIVNGIILHNIVIEPYI